MSSTLSLRRNPVSLVFSAAPWAGIRYIFTYLFVAWGLFAVALIIVVGTGTVFGIPVVLVAGTALIRGCATVERARLRTADPRPVKGAYRDPAGPGVVARLRGRWGDRAIWRDIAYLFGMLAPLWILDFAAAARNLLRPPGDPLRQAKEVLRRPGPLSTSAGYHAKEGS